MSILRHSQSVSLAHRYWNNLWSHERNRAVYGSSSSPEGVGSNIKVEAEIAVDGDFDFAPVADLIKSRLDHRCLTDEVDEFSRQPCTLESVAAYLGRELFDSGLPGGARWRSLTLWELDRYGVRIEPGRATVDFFLHYRNLLVRFGGPVDAESRLAVSRVESEKTLAEIFKTFSAGTDEPEFIWLGRLYASIRSRLAGVMSLTVDLGSHKLTTQSPASDNGASNSGHWPGDVYEEHCDFAHRDLESFDRDRM